MPTSPLIRSTLLLASVLHAAACARSADGEAPRDSVAAVSAASSASSIAEVVPHYADTAQLQRDAQALVQAFADQVARARGGPLASVPTVRVRNTPALIYFDADSNHIVVPWWDTAPAQMRDVFRTFAGGDDTAGAHLFRANFNRFLVAHEASHWFAMRSHQEADALYDAENQANRMAVAFWRTQPGGDALLDEVERLSAGAAERLADPTPAGEDAVAYFGANYQTLSMDPLKYGYYQFRFMRDAVRARTTLDFAQLAAVTPRGR